MSTSTGLFEFKILLKLGGTDTDYSVPPTLRRELPECPVLVFIREKQRYAIERLTQLDQLTITRPKLERALGVSINIGTIKFWFVQVRAGLLQHADRGITTEFKL